MNVILLDCTDSRIKDVSVNQDGSFSIVTYLDTFKVEVDLDTLPDYFGVTKKYVTIDSQDYDFDLPIYFQVLQINKVDAELKGGIVCTSFYSDDNTKLFVKHDSNVTYNYKNLSFWEFINVF